LNSPTPLPAPSTLSLASKVKWIAIAFMLLVVYLLLRPFLVERYGLALPGFTDVKPQGNATTPESTTKAQKEKTARNRPVDVPVIPEQSEPVVEDQAVAVNAEPATDPKVERGPRPSEIGIPAPQNASPSRPEKTPGVDSTSTSANASPNTNPRRTTPPKANPKPPNTRTPVSPPNKSTAPVVATQNTKPKPTTGTPATSPAGKPATPTAPARPELGVLKSIGRDRFESTAGLVYNQYRIDHVMLHAQDDTTKPSHGVFDLTTQAEVLSLVDEAYELSKKGRPPQVVIEDEGDRTTYMVNMNRKIGHSGGKGGGNRPLNRLKIVLEGNEVVTAFPQK
jgi:hypothetical protein